MQWGKFLFILVDFVRGSTRKQHLYFYESQTSYGETNSERNDILTYKWSTNHSQRSKIFEVLSNLLSVLLVHKYNGEDEPQIKIADFGLSRDFASTYMTGTLGTYVKF